MFKIFTEAGFNKGFGHYSRIFGICEVLNEKNFEFKVFMDADDSAQKVIGHKKYIVFENWLDYDCIIKLVNSQDIVLLDSYYYDIDFLERVKNICEEVIIIDDNIRLDYHDVCIINPNYFSEYLKYPKQNGNKYYLGKDYTLLKRNFIPPDCKKINEKVENILITMGGSDVLQLTHRIIEYLHSFNNEAELQIVVTSAFKNLDKIEEKINDRDKLWMDIDGKQMASLMRNADFAISSAGGTSNELIKMMCPAILIAVADNQYLNIKYLYENNLVDVFDIDSMYKIKNMFNINKRKKLIGNLKGKYSNKSAIDLILNIINKEND